MARLLQFAYNVNYKWFYIRKQVSNFYKDTVVAEHLHAEKHGINFFYLSNILQLGMFSGF